jgi:hypothetical protein
MFQLKQTQNAFHIDYFHEEVRPSIHGSEMYWQIYWCLPPTKKVLEKESIPSKCGWQHLHVEE